MRGSFSLGLVWLSMGERGGTMANLKVGAVRVAAMVVTIVSMACAAEAQDLAADTQALLTFRAAFDPRGTVLKWTNTTSPCAWDGVVCASDRVSEIRLPGAGLRGEIPPSSLSLLSELRVISLRNNRLTGPFPGELGRCVHVHGLYLGGNAFFGTVPNLTGFWPHLTHFSLEYNGFNGTIPDSIGLFTRLYLLNLSNNSFSGSIPPFDLPKLTTFDVANNNLSGAVPTSLAKFGTLPFLGNPGLCGFPLATVCPPTSPSPTPSSSPSSSPIPSPSSSPIPSPSSSPIPGPIPGPIPSPSSSPSPSPSPSPHAQGGRSKKLLSAPAITAIVVGGVAMLVLFAIGFLLCCKRVRALGGAPGEAPGREKGKGKGKVEGLGEEYASAMPGEIDRKLVFFHGKQYSFDLEDLLRASAEVLGKGSVGTVYKAVLEDGTVLAVKRLKDVTTGRKDFESQIDVVGKLHHRNLVPLRAFYFSKEGKLLVYEFLPMGSLSALLHDRGIGAPPLDWESRVRIAVGVARGLAYLHAQGGGHRFVHGNIKSSNVLLFQDPNLEACISDFAQAQLLNSTVATARAVGYRAPEITKTRKLTQKSDVYSFGVLLLELLTGKAPNQVSMGDEGIDLPQWVQSVVREEWTAEVFDLELMRYDNIEEEMVAMLQLAMQCVESAPDRRPSMSDLLPMLEDVHPFASDTGDEASAEEKSPTAVRPKSPIIPQP